MRSNGRLRHRLVHLENTINRRISILVYDDIEAAHDYLIRVFGFGPGELTRDPDGNVVHAEIEAGDGEFWLTISYEPVDQPYGYREYSAADPEGHLWSFLKPLS